MSFSTRSLPLCTGRCALSQSFGSRRIGLDQVVAVTFRMRRSEADAFQPFDLVNGFEELDEGVFSSLARRGKACVRIRDHSSPVVTRVARSSTLLNPRLP